MATQEVSGRRCQTCGRDVEADWKSCPYCGAVVPPTHGPLIRLCERCGAKVWVQAEACAACGLPARTAAPADVPAPPALDPEPPPAPAPRTRFGRLRRVRVADGGTAIALGVTFALVLGLGGLFGVAANWTGIGQAVGPSCSFGVTGTPASITVRGWSARDACSALRSGASFETYALDREHQEQPTICRVSVLNDQILVHDDHSDAAGVALCRALQTAAAAPAVAPSP